MDTQMRATAPGPLGDLQDFLNSGHLEAADWLPSETVDAIRLRAGEGESRAALASQFGLPQVFVSALTRGVAVYDELQTAESAGEWLVSRSLLSAGEELGEAAHLRLLELRELLRRLAIANTHGPLSEGDAALLNEFATSAPLVVAFEGPLSSAALRPAGNALPRAVGGLLAILFEATRDGSWQRLRRCPGDGCPFTFYDSSRNRTGTWCSMAVCGNRAKVRGYQARKRQERAG